MTPMPATCAADGCCQPRAKGRKGYCSRHYYRMHQYGRLDVVTAPKGAPEDFLQSHAANESDECVMWPFAKMKGYGVLQHEGQTMLASRRMCILKHGEPPFPDAQAAHTCGKGNQGCVSHVYWATPQQNIEDKRLHGTQPQGEMIWNAKLNDQSIRYIRKSRESARVLAKTFDCSPSAIKKVRRGESWKHVSA